MSRTVEMQASPWPHNFRSCHCAAGQGPVDPQHLPHNSEQPSGMGHLRGRQPNRTKLCCSLGIPPLAYPPQHAHYGTISIRTGKQHNAPVSAALYRRNSVPMPPAARQTRTYDQPFRLALCAELCRGLCRGRLIESEEPKPDSSHGTPVRLPQHWQERRGNESSGYKRHSALLCPGSLRTSESSAVGRYRVPPEEFKGWGSPGWNGSEARGGLDAEVWGRRFLPQPGG